MGRRTIWIRQEFERYLETYAARQEVSFSMAVMEHVEFARRELRRLIRRAKG